MSNMSYCRFENTASDLRDCLHAIHNGEASDLSSYEISGLSQILELATEIYEMDDLIKGIIERENERLNNEYKSFNEAPYENS